MIDAIIKALPIIGVFIFMSCINSYKNKKEKDLASTNLKSVHNIEDVKAFVKKIDELGFFKYANNKDAESLKKNYIKNFDSNGEICSDWDDETGIPKDLRYYFCDGEDLYEEGGFRKMILKLNPTFKKIKFKCLIVDNFEEWDSKNNWLNHTININGTKYIVFKNFSQNGWGEAAKRFAEILNIELEKQKIDEQVYLVNGGNDGRLVFLNFNLYGYLYGVYKNDQWKPLDVNNWCKVMGI